MCVGDQAASVGNLIHRPRENTFHPCIMRVHLLYY